MGISPPQDSWIWDVVFLRKKMQKLAYDYNTRFLENKTIFSLLHIHNSPYQVPKSSQKSNCSVVVVIFNSVELFTLGKRKSIWEIQVKLRHNSWLLKFFQSSRVKNTRIQTNIKRPRTVTAQNRGTIAMGERNFILGNQRKVSGKTSTWQDTEHQGAAKFYRITST